MERRGKMRDNMSQTLGVFEDLQLSEVTYRNVISTS